MLLGLFPRLTVAVAVVGIDFGIAVACVLDHVGAGIGFDIDVVAECFVGFDIDLAAVHVADCFDGCDNDFDVVPVADCFVGSDIDFVAVTAADVGFGLEFADVVAECSVDDVDDFFECDKDFFVGWGVGKR